ncbi:phytoene desaturase family protein [Occallatibacter riparius]|uniref:NAD(P)/FAD-dependent oxidoreductase n=1 Tax=Occallatibacter riparius TaxID=1002689 RepID=A0A9J7BRD3_9BACT|nr:NAD(P)/FAD-dependent oxidoreductase [Occallatibacter riparius]UWZ85232.1 NAD(P)/FAD-dependent oxidoreductase [Occallatibacter riparius]
MQRKNDATATVIGSGPNGLSAAIVLAATGIPTTVFERNLQPGGGCSSGETTLPGFIQDLGSAAYPLGKASPFFRSLPIDIPWIESPAPCAHPLDDGTAIVIERSIEATVDFLDECDRSSYRSLFEPLVMNFGELVEEILGPIQQVPQHPLLLAMFGSMAVLPAAALARYHFKGRRAQALFGGVATHSSLSLESTASSAVGLILLAAGHSGGWPILRGGAQTLTDALIRHLTELGGTIVTAHEITRMPQTDLVLADLTPHQLLKLKNLELSPRYFEKLKRFRYGPGVFKIDYALSCPIPWTASDCSRAATIHIGGSLEEIVEAEHRLDVERPFVLLGQPSLFDSTRAPAGGHTAWAYCHVPNASETDYTDAIERQISRFAPGFRDCILSRSVSTPAALERWNPNLVGGDILGGSMNLRQLIYRPTSELYRTSKPGLYLCGASTPPGGGVHGMAGYHAARVAINDLGS